MTLAELKELATEAANWESGSRPWRACSFGTLWTVNHYDPDRPDDKAEEFDVFEDPPKDVAKFVAACSPTEILNLIAVLEAACPT